jgi:hypothetical protein
VKRRKVSQYVPSFKPRVLRDVYEAAPHHVLGTFGQHLGNLLGTFAEHSRNSKLSSDWPHGIIVLDVPIGRLVEHRPKYKYKYLITNIKIKSKIRNNK